jgi:hypothetical protein
MPFARAAEELAHFRRLTVEETAVRRRAEAAGAAYVAVQDAQAAAIRRDAPAAPVGPARQLLSADGAMVPLLGGQWAEVKTLAIGAVQPPVWEAQAEAWVVHTTDLSCFSRLADAAGFTEAALVETHRRGTETAGTVCAVMDGAEWEQGFVDRHRPDARRILDFPHAVGYLAQVAEAAWGDDPMRRAAWLDGQRQELLTGDPARVLARLRALLAAAAPADPARETVAASLGYLEKRRAQVEYAAFAAAGYPLGSGPVESANKLVVEARLKGAGMHWAPAHVNPMVALRTIACGDRWAEAWPQLAAQQRRQARARAAARRPRPAPAPAAAPTSPPAAPPVLADLPRGRRDPPPSLAPPPAPASPAPPPARPRAIPGDGGSSVRAMPPSSARLSAKRRRAPATFRLREASCCCRPCQRTRTCTITSTRCGSATTSR